MQYSSFRVWLVHSAQRPLGSSSVSNGRISLFLKVGIYTTFSLSSHSSTDIWACFHSLTIVEMLQWAWECGYLSLIVLKKAVKQGWPWRGVCLHVSLPWCLGLKTEIKFALAYSSTFFNNSPQSWPPSQLLSLSISLLCVLHKPHTFWSLPVLCVCVCKNV